MDIDPFWVTTGGSGWFPISHYNFISWRCLTNQSLKTQLPYIVFTIMWPTTAFLLLLLISPLFARPIYSSSSTTRNLHPFSTSSTSIPATQTPGKNGATDGRFEADVHEVPSGPNPESNNSSLLERYPSVLIYVSLGAEM
ncbi:hypothetical protein CXB51_025877 [Gossypium anomalum]|uniref:Uncharacterized protein n=1 Tax=Gossypium anomalum TaxID=47600 RepID=A0A8J6CN58_9ROSI|nr:hypothetical protein CXB51_025877 [Gossypium anomalum]